MLQTNLCLLLNPGMSSDFIASYISGAIGIIIGNPLDLVKVRLQATGIKSTNNKDNSTALHETPISRFGNARSLVKGIYISRLLDNVCIDFREH